MTNTIQRELTEVYNDLDSRPFGSFDGLHGETIHIDPDQDTLDLLARGAALVELMHLREPVMDVARVQRTMAEEGLMTDWAMHAYHKQCPCPGVPEYQWNAD